MRIIAPEPLRNSFTCPYCETTAVQAWYAIESARSVYPAHAVGDYVCDPDGDLYSCIMRGGGFSRSTGNPELAHWGISECSNCSGLMVWRNDQIMYPEVCPVEEPNEDMPEDVQKVYTEAAQVYSRSPRASAALLRLALQMLLKQILGSESRSAIYDDLKTLVEKGANSQIIKVMDIIRFEGNESVHPGEIDLNDEPDTARILFTFINMIVEQFFSGQRRIDELYARIPERKRVPMQ